MSKYFKFTKLPLVRQLYVVIGATLNYVGNGCVHGYASVLLSQLTSDNDEGIQFDKDSTSTFTSILGICALIGILIAPLFTRVIGRRGTHLLSTLPYMIGWLLTYFATNVTMLYVARAMHGFGFGLKTPTNFVIVGEYTSPRYRGAFLAAFGISLNAGIFYTHFLGTILTWRMTALASLVVPIVAAIIIATSPESPCWLVTKGRLDEAKNAFVWLRGDKELQELEELIETQKENDQNTTRTISKLAYIRKISNIIILREFYIPAIVLVNMNIVYDFCGNHLLPTYAHVILPAVFNKEDTNVELVTLDVVRIGCSVLTVYILKKFKRRTILSFSGFLTVACCVIIAGYIYLISYSLISESYYFIFVVMVIYVVSFCIGLIPLPTVLCGELFPLKYRSISSSLTNIFLPIAYTIALKTAPDLFSSVGVNGAYLVWGSITFVGVSIVLLLVPETKDRTLQDIEKDLKRVRNEQNNLEVESKLI